MRKQIVRIFAAFFVGALGFCIATTACISIGFMLKVLVASFKLGWNFL